MEKMMIRALKPLLAAGIKRKYPSAATIFHQGEMPKSAAVVIDGMVKVFSISPQGEEQVIAYHARGDILPLPWIFDSNQVSLFFYEACPKAEIIFLSRSSLTDFLLKDKNASLALIKYLTTSTVGYMLRVNALEQSKAKDKLIQTIYYLCLRYGKKQGAKTVIPFHLTHQNIADLVGLTRETTALHLSKLRKDKILTYQKRTYTVDLQKIIKLMADDSFSSLNISV